MAGGVGRWERSKGEVEVVRGRSGNAPERVRVVKSRARVVTRTRRRETVEARICDHFDRESRSEATKPTSGAATASSSRDW